MKLGFISILLLCVLVVIGGAVAYLVLADVPVTQQEITVDVPLAPQ